MDQRTSWPARLNAEQTANYLAVSRPVVLRALAAGELPAIRVGRRWIVDRRALDARLGISDQPAPVRRR